MTFRPAILLVAAAVAVVDQDVKWWALEHLSDGHRVSLLGDWLGLQLVSNSGAAFSLLDEATWIVTIVMVLVTVGLVWFSGRARGWTGVVIFGAALGGALGNLADRLFRAPGFGRGHVVDMIAYHDWFVGNVADIAVVGAAALAVVLGWRGVPLMEPAKPRE